MFWRRVCAECYLNSVVDSSLASLATVTTLTVQDPFVAPHLFFVCTGLRHISIDIKPSNGQHTEMSRRNLTMATVRYLRASPSAHLVSYNSIHPVILVCLVGNSVLRWLLTFSCSCINFCFGYTHARYRCAGRFRVCFFSKSGRSKAWIAIQTPRHTHC